MNVENSLIDWHSHPITKKLIETLTDIKEESKNQALSVAVLDSANRNSQLDRLFGRTQIIDIVLYNEFIDREEN